MTAHDMLGWIGQAAGTIYRKYKVVSPVEDSNNRAYYEEIFFQNHPNISTDQYENDKIQTFQNMAGGIYLFDDFPVPANARTGTLTPWRNTLADYAMDFRRTAVKVWGRPATWRELFWVVWYKYAQTAQHLPTDDRYLNISLVEMRGDVFRFFMDLDLLFGSPMKEQRWDMLIENMAEHINQAIMACFPEVPSTSPIFFFTVLENVAYVKKPEGKVKRGVHIVWPNLAVDQKRAMLLAVAAEIYLSRSMGRVRDPTKGENSWRDVVDTSVYNSGLRIPGCAKAEVCKNPDNPACGQLHRNYHKIMKEAAAASKQGHRMIDGYAKALCCPDHSRKPSGMRFDKSTIYKVTRVWQAGDYVNLPDLVASYAIADPDRNAQSYNPCLMHLASIRTQETIPTEGFRQNKDLDAVWNIMSLESRSGVVSGKRPYGVKSERSSFARDHEIRVSGVLNAKLELIVRQCGLSKHYENIVITRVIGFPVHKSGKEIWLPTLGSEAPQKSLYREVVLCTTGEGSRFCLKKGAEHNSSTVKFHLGADGTLVQSCWSPKVYHFGTPCKNYTSAKVSKQAILSTAADKKVLVQIMTSPLEKDHSAKHAKTDDK